MAVSIAIGEKKVRSMGSLQKAWFRFTRKKLAVAALCFIVFEMVLTSIAPLLVKANILFDPYYNDYVIAYQAPTARHPFGTDEFGRDMVSRIIYGAQVSYFVGIGSTLIVTLIGLTIGSLAGLIGGWLDYVLMRFIEVVSTIPMIMVYVLMMIALGAGLINMLIAMSVTGWIGVARLVRGEVLSLKQTDYVRASKAMGGGTLHIIFAHLFRNALSPVIISAALGVPGAMLAEAGMSFLGLGIVPPTPSWGYMAGAYQSFILAWPWLVVWPSVAVTLTMLAWILLGDGLRDALDPNIRV